MNHLRKWKIFLSSTSHDLQQIRDKAAPYLTGLGFEVVRFEDNFRIDPEKHSHEVCIENVRDVDMIVLFLDCRFGSAYKFDENISITQAEYREGIKKNIPVFHFIKKDLKEEYYSLLQKAKKKAKNHNEINLVLDNLRKFKPTYADEIGLISFVGEIFNSDFGNFSIFYDDWGDLQNKLTGRLRDYTPVLLRRLMGEQRRQLLHGDESRLWFSLEEILNLKLYNKPRWSRVAGVRISKKNDDLAKSIPVWLNEGKHVLIRGKAGAGKTTELSRAFLSDTSNTRGISSFTVFIRLKDLSTVELSMLTIKKLVNIQTTKLLKRSPIPYCEKTLN